MQQCLTIQWRAHIYNKHKNKILTDDSKFDVRFWYVRFRTTHDRVVSLVKISQSSSNWNYTIILISSIGCISPKIFPFLVKWSVPSVKSLSTTLKHCSHCCSLGCLNARSKTAMCCWVRWMPRVGARSRPLCTASKDFVWVISARSICWRWWSCSSSASCCCACWAVTRSRNSSVDQHSTSFFIWRSIFSSPWHPGMNMTRVIHRAYVLTCHQSSG